MVVHETVTRSSGILGETLRFQLVFKNSEIPWGNTYSVFRELFANLGFSIQHVPGIQACLSQTPSTLTRIMGHRAKTGCQPLQEKAESLEPSSSGH